MRKPWSSNPPRRRRGAAGREAAATVLMPSLPQQRRCPHPVAAWTRSSGGTSRSSQVAAPTSEHQQQRPTRRQPWQWLPPFGGAPYPLATYGGTPFSNGRQRLLPQPEVAPIPSHTRWRRIPAAADQHPPGIRTPYLPFLLSETEHPNRRPTPTRYPLHSPVAHVVRSSHLGFAGGAHGAVGAGARDQLRKWMSRRVQPQLTKYKKISHSPSQFDHCFLRPDACLVPARGHRALARTQDG